MKVVVIGGGVMGLMTARELVSAGCETVLLERSSTGREASWAGGGIVSPLYPWRYPEPVTALARQAQDVYPALAEALREETGIDPEFLACGLLMLDAQDDRDALAWSQRHQRRMYRGDGAFLSRDYPWLASHWQSGLWMPDIGNIRNPRLLAALRQSLLDKGVRLHEQAEVRSWRQQSGRALEVVMASGQRLAADAFVVCSGAWSAALLQPLGITALPVRPVRGQMLLYKLEPGELPCMVLAEGRYLIPRRDGHVLCGSTLEEVGFDKRTTEDALLSLQASAARLWPRLAGMSPIAQWAGLRPAAPNGIPFIGAVPGIGNVWVNAGQFRNGLVLAPASSRLMADLILARSPRVDPAPYQLLA